MSKKHKKVCMTLNYIENFLILVSEGYGEWLTSNSWEHLKFISLNNHPYQAGPTLFNINSDETLFCRFTVSANKCGRNCNIIDDPYARVSFASKVKNMNVKVFNLMSGVNETRFLVQHELCECKCRLN